MGKRKYDTTKPATQTLVEVSKQVWYQFKLISSCIGKSKKDAFEEALQDFNEKHKGIL